MKKNLRKQLLETRNTLTAPEISHRSAEIFCRLKERHDYQNANNVMVYLSFLSEVITKEIINDLLSKGKRVFIPLTVPKTREMIISELLNPEEDLEIGNFGVLEPKKEAVRPVDPSILDLVLVPGVGFDERGYRVGYGAGYYDRFLPKLDQMVPTIALAFDLQLIDHVPNDAYDFPVQYIITETKLIDCGAHK